MDVQGKELFLVLLGVALGLPPAIVVARHCFKRSFAKSLTPYLMFHASPMSGMSPAVRSTLSIDFKGRKVENLIEAQFVVINDGDKAIRDIIEPLKLRAPPQLQLLDAEVVRRDPQSLAVDSALLPEPEGASGVSFHIPLLNAHEWCAVKVVADGPASATDWKWTIIADELPRSLDLRRLSLKDLDDLPMPLRERVAWFALALVSVAGGAAVYLGMGWLSAWYPGVKEDWLLSLVVEGAAVMLMLIGVVVFSATAAFASKAMRGLRPLRRPLPNLPDDVVADVWRGHSAQPNTVARSKKVPIK